MIALIQRVARASVTIDSQITAAIGQGMLILICVTRDDTEQDMEYVARKCAALRIFDDEDHVMNRSITDIEGQILVVSQFTLAAQTRRGNRPSYINAAPHETAIPLYTQFCHKMRALTSLEVQTGSFGADMKVELINDGPVTIYIDSHNP